MMINLLPQKEIKKLKEEENFKIILHLFFLILIFAIFLFLMLISTKIYLEGNLKYREIIFSTTEKSLNLEKEKEISKYNEILRRFDEFYAKEDPLFTKMEILFEKIPQNNISLKDVELKREKNREIIVAISGIAKKRNDFLSLINTLKEHYTDVSFSPDLLFKEEQIEFFVKFKIK